MTVYVGKVEDYNLEEIENKIRESFNVLEIDLTGKKTALIKPNIVVPAKPDSGVITHPKIVEALVNVLKDYKFEDIVIAEGVGVGQSPEEAFNVSGYRELAERMNLKLVDLDKEDRVKVDWKYGKIGLPKIVIESDVYINLPKIKTHGQTTVTLSMKNQKGLLLPSDKKNFHRRFGLHEPIVEFAKVIKPGIILTDGVWGIEGEGPLRGKKKKSGVIVIGKNMVEVDSACSKIIGIEPTEITHLKMASDNGLGSLNPEVKGTSIEETKVEFVRAHKEYGRVMKIYSWRNPYACSMCIHSFSCAVRLAIRKPRYWFTVIPKLAFYSILGKLHIVQGKHAKIPAKDGRIICLGDCTKELSEKQNFTWIRGCPPTSENILKKL